MFKTMSVRRLSAGVVGAAALAFFAQMPGAAQAEGLSGCELCDDLRVSVSSTSAEVDGRDFLAWQRSSSPDVDGPDFLVWQRGNSPAPATTNTDLALWRSNYGAGQ